MLGSDLLSVRLGGVYALDNLAEEYPEQYHLQIMRLFCAFIRHPNGSAGSAIVPISEEPWPQYDHDEGVWREKVLQEVILQEVIAQEVATQDEQQPLVREDVQEIINLLRKRSDKRIALEQQSGFVPDLRGASLQHANLARMKWDRAMFSNADLSYSNLYRTSLKKAILRGAKVPSAMLNETDLSGAMLADADLSGAILENTNLSGARFYDPDSRTMVRGLTQDQLDMARADSSNPPFLEHTIDVETGSPLTWSTERQERSGPTRV